MRWTGHVAHVKQRIGTYRIWVPKLEGKRKPVGSKRRWCGDIKTDFQ